VGGTERAFTGAYWETKTLGIYVCVCCGLPLFDSDDKLDSGSGWPSYSDVIDPEHVETRADDSLGMGRVAVRAATRTAVTFSRTDRHPRESATA